MDPRNPDSFILSLNKKAMDLLRNEDYKSSLSCLKKAESLLSSSGLENRKKLCSLTLNNFGCFYKRANNINLALDFVKKAQEVESQPPVNISNLAGTHLNMCAILSTIGDHSQALSNAIKALNLLKSKYLEDPSLITALVAAHHNTGVEHEHLGQLAEAEKIFKKGLFLAHEQLGGIHPLTLSLNSSIKSLVQRSHERNRSLNRASPGGKPKTLLIRRNKSTDKGNRGKTEAFQKIESVRFITGDRLRPMFKREELRLRQNRVNLGLAVELKQEKETRKEEVTNFHYIEAGKESNISASELPKNDENTAVSEQANTFELTKTLEQVSTGTQVELFDKRFFSVLREKAATLIQRNVRVFFAKRKFQYLKYRKILKDSEEKIKDVKARLKNLRSSKKVKNEAKELIPIVYKDKLDSPARTAGVRMSRICSRLTTIIEENDDITAKVVKIQKTYRGWTVRRVYLVKRASAIFIQKYLKKFQVQRLYLKIRDAIVFIQRCWRRCLLKNIPLKSTILRKKDKL